MFKKDDPFRFFKIFGAGFAVWFVFCLLLSLGMLAGGVYAVYWGLSLAERAVEQNEQQPQTQEDPTHQYVLPDAG